MCVCAWEIEEENPVALSEKDKQWIAGEIRSALKGRGLSGRVLRFISDWGALSVAASVVLFVLSQWGDYREFRGTVTAQLSNIQSELARQTAVNHSSLPITEFRSTLPELFTALSTLKSKKLNTPISVVDQLQSKLAQTEADAPGFWPAASVLVSYKSEQTRPTSNLPDCVLHDPEPPRVIAVSPDHTQMSFTAPTYRNCKFTIDSERDDAVVSYWINKSHWLLTFDHCLIVYNGGPIKLPTEVHDDKGFVVNSFDSNHRLIGSATYAHPYTWTNPIDFQGCSWDIEIKARPSDAFGSELTLALLQSPTLDIKTTS